MSLNIVNPTTGQTTKVAGEFDTTAIEEITEQLTANDTPFRFGYDETTGKYGYIINEGGADTVIPFKDCDSSEITVSAANQILSGYKDYDSNGNLITGTNAGYDAGVAQGEANMKDGVTVTAASQLLSGYKARTSDGTLVTGSDAGYSAGVTQGHADRDSGVTVTDPYHILSGFKGRKSNGELVTGTNGGWDAGRSQGQADRDSGVTVTNSSQIVNGYKARNSSGTLLTGTADVSSSLSVKNNTPKVRDNSTNPSNATQSASITKGQIAILSGYSYGGSGKGSVTFNTPNTKTISETSSPDNNENLAKTRVVRATASATITVTVIAGNADSSKQGASSSIVILG